MASLAIHSFSAPRMPASTIPHLLGDPFLGIPSPLRAYRRIPLPSPQFWTPRKLCAPAEHRAAASGMSSEWVVNARRNDAPGFHAKPISSVSRRNASCSFTRAHGMTLPLGHTKPISSQTSFTEVTQMAPLHEHVARSRRGHGARYHSHLDLFRAHVGCRRNGARPHWCLGNSHAPQKAQR